MAYLDVARGRWGSANAHLDSVAELDPAASLQHRARLATLPFLPLPREELQDLRTQLEEWSPTTAPRPNPYLPLYTGMSPPIRLYLLGLLSARLEDYTAALRYSEALAGSRSEAPLTDILAAAIRARVEFMRGDPRQALAELEAAQVRNAVPPLDLPPTGSHGHERHLYPELLRRLDRPPEALRWYSSLPWYRCALGEHST